MTDHIIDEGQRIIALARLRLTEARARAAVARMLLGQLRQCAQQITTADAHDYAYAVWAEFCGETAREIGMPLDLQAGVFAQAAPFLDEPTIFRIARETWGEGDMEVQCGLDRVVWMPADDLLIVTAGHLHADGSAGQLELVVSPLRITRSQG